MRTTTQPPHSPPALPSSLESNLGPSEGLQQGPLPPEIYDFPPELGDILPKLSDSESEINHILHFPRCLTEIDFYPHKRWTVVQGLSSPLPLPSNPPPIKPVEPLPKEVDLVLNNRAKQAQICHRSTEEKVVKSTTYGIYFSVKIAPTDEEGKVNVAIRPSLERRVSTVVSYSELEPKSNMAPSLKRARNELLHTKEPLTRQDLRERLSISIPSSKLEDAAVREAFPRKALTTVYDVQRILIDKFDIILSKEVILDSFASKYEICILEPRYSKQELEDIAKEYNQGINVRPEVSLLKMTYLGYQAKKKPLSEKDITFLQNEAVKNRANLTQALAIQTLKCLGKCAPNNMKEVKQAIKNIRSHASYKNKRHKHMKATKVITQIIEEEEKRVLEEVRNSMVKC